MELRHTRDLRARTPLVPPPRDPRPARLTLPAGLPAVLGYDAVGTSREHGERIMECLPRVGCVFAHDELWWWIVPADSHIGVTWPVGTLYAVGARVAEPSCARTRSRARPGGPRLIHAPAGDSPYTPPIPLYFLACRLVGSTPHWSLGSAN
ncbi:hypothetical protein [Streptomyces sp. NPDC046862]|uniref:hypothetical protein n=1 Tax=Streptomyces sp. NPDC046862 TaxID=3154603 RepID=UPI003453E82D